MSWFSAFFKRDTVKAFLKIGLRLLKLFLGGVAESLQAIAQDEVSRAEQSGKSGKEKYEAAFKAVKARFPELRESAINLAIEIAVNALQQGL